MIFALITNVDRFFILPSLYVGSELCQDRACGEEHRVIGLSWLCWSAEVVF